MTDPRQAQPPHVELLGAEEAAEPPFDPLRLCVYTTVAALGWLLGPSALLGFAALAVLGYAKARRAGLLRSKCKLGDTRLVLLYLVVLAVVAGYGIYVSLR